MVWVLREHEREDERTIHADAVERLERFDDFASLQRFIATYCPFSRGWTNLPSSGIRCMTTS